MNGISNASAWLNIKGKSFTYGQFMHPFIMWTFKSFCFIILNFHISYFLIVRDGPDGYFYHRLQAIIKTLSKYLVSTWVQALLLSLPCCLWFRLGTGPLGPTCWQSCFPKSMTSQILPPIAGRQKIACSCTNSRRDKHWRWSYRITYSKGPKIAEVTRYFTCKLEFISESESALKLDSQQLCLWEKGKLVPLEEGLPFACEHDR